MKLLRTPETQIKLSQARLLMSEALGILDDLGEIGEVGTHLDLALCRLETHLGVDEPGIGGVQNLRAALEKELRRPSSSQGQELPWELNRI